jgi:nitrogen regulatory protein P-II 1
MKFVVADIRNEKVSDVLDALYKADVPGLTISRVVAEGRSENLETVDGPTVRFEIGVAEALVETTVQTIVAAARTGDGHDGSILVLPVERVYRISGDEEGPAIVPPAAARTFSEEAWSVR